MKRFSAILTLAALFAAASFAQTTGKFAGHVKDAQTGEPVIGCNITVTGTSFGASTDLDGAFFILNVTPGKYSLQASMIGYRKVVQTDAIINAGKTTIVDFTLTSEAIEQAAVVIEATRPDVEKEKTSTSAIVRFDDVKTLAGVASVNDILGLAADVTDGHFRGGREGEEYYTLQGMGITNPLDNSTAFLPIMSAVEEVEVITSGFGAQYGNAQSGIVNISMKEGSADRWNTRIESRTRAPQRKHFGPSIFDPSANPYLSALLDPRIWQLGDPNTGNTPYFLSMGSGLKDRYAGDPAVQLAVARTLWQMQTKRDMFRSYGNDVDYSVEAGTGGPIDEKNRMFLALRTNSEWPVYPTEQPDVERQIMGNLSSDLGGGSVLRISGGFSQNDENVFPSVNGLGYFNWMWDRILSIDYRKTTNLQLGARFTHAFTPSTFGELKFNSLWTKRKVGSTPAPPSIADSLIVNPLNDQIDWDKVIPQVIGSPDGFYYLRGDDEFRDELTRTFEFEASITSQATKSHLLNAGIQLHSYLLDVRNSLNTRRGAGGPFELYNVHPFDGALYIQDKMEFEGMIANAGLRFDVWDANASSYVVYQEGIPIVTPSTTTDQMKTPLVARLEPRIGISFPVSVNTVFHINYGSFMQRPSFQYVVSSRVQQGLSTLIQVGNPRLLPEVTNSYDVGVTQGLGQGFTLDVSGYYKDVKNLIETATFSNYTTWFNRDYADIRGFRVAVSKRRGDFTGSVNYQYGVATGKSATTSYAPVAFNTDPQTGLLIADNTKVPVRDILLDFDRTHNLVVTLGYVTPADFGPFAGLTLTSNSFFRSGRPYTSPSAPKLINGSRTPGEYNTNIRLTKTFGSFFGAGATLYFEVFNLFDNKIYNYDYIFSTPNANTTSNNAYRFEHYAVDDPANGLLYHPDTNPPLPWGVDQSFLLYSNNPRSLTIGFTLEL